MTGTQKNKVHVIVVIFCIIVLAVGEEKGQEGRSLGESSEFSDKRMEGIVNYTIEFLSGIINLLKKALVLSALLFLIQNLINFWILASSYAFLAVKIPSFMSNTFYNIHTAYNDSFKGYFNLDIQDPKFNISNRLSLHQKNSQILQFNWLSFLFEPTIMILVTIIWLSIFKCLLKNIKSKVRQKRQEYIKKVIEKRLQKINNKLVQKQPQKEERSIFNIFQSKKIENVHQNESNKDKKLSFNKIVANLTYKMMYTSVKDEFSKQKKHWSQAIYINIPQKVSAVVINYMTGILIPAYSILINNKVSTFTEKINMSIYYFLLGFIFVYPLVSIALGRTDKKRNCEKKFFKKSEIESLSQYYLNFFMSTSLGITDSILPFFAITTFILSAMLLNSFMQNNSHLSLKTLSCQKLNNIIHKFTFWLFNLTFFVMIGFSHYPELASYSEDIIYYCSLSCIIIFIIGGCHEILQFMIIVFIFMCKMTYMLFQIITSQQEMLLDHQKQQIHQEIFKKQTTNLQNNQHITPTKQTKHLKQRNIFDFDQEQEDYQDRIQHELHKCNIILKQLIIQQIE